MIDSNKEYKKGDSVIWKHIYRADEKTALVLDNGMRGKDFIHAYCGLTIPYFFLDGYRLQTVQTCWKWAVGGHEEIEDVYYYVMIGDEKGWTEHCMLSKIEGHV